MADRILVIYIEAELALLYAAPPENTKEKRAQDFVDRAKKSLLSALPPWCVVGQLTAWKSHIPVYRLYFLPHWISAMASKEYTRED